MVITHPKGKTMKKTLNPIIAAVLIGLSSLAFAGGPSCDGHDGQKPAQDWSKMTLEQRQDAFIKHHDAMVDQAVAKGTLTKAEGQTLKEANTIVAKKLLPEWKAPPMRGPRGPKPVNAPIPASAD